MFLTGLGLPLGMLRNPQEWGEEENRDAQFQRLLQTPLKSLVRQSQLCNLLASDGILKGCFLVEVVLYRDITRALPPVKPVESGGGAEEEHHTAASSSSINRTLKLVVTDGAIEFVCLEYEPCNALDLVRVGAKLQLKDVYYLNGLLLLKPSCVQFLGAPNSLQAWRIGGEEKTEVIEIL